MSFSGTRDVDRAPTIVNLAGVQPQPDTDHTRPRNRKGGRMHAVLVDAPCAAPTLTRVPADPEREPGLVEEQAGYRTADEAVAGSWTWKRSRKRSRPGIIWAPL